MADENLTGFDPVHPIIQGNRVQEGITIREEFAKSIMAGFAGGIDIGKVGNDTLKTGYVDRIANTSIMWADRLITRLNGGSSGTDE